MSIWGPRPFENDDAADWVADLVEDPTIDVLREALSEAADPEHLGYLEVTDGAEAVAAAEVLAQLLGMPGRQRALKSKKKEAQLRDQLEREGVRERRRLLKQALSALEVVMNDDENSELRQLWEEDKPGMARWIANMQDLERRLQTIAKQRG